MARPTPEEYLNAGLEDLGSPVISAYLPKPHTQTFGEKFRILSKNFQSELEQYGDLGAALSERIGELEIDDFRGFGMALFTDGEKVRSFQLHRRPFAMIYKGDIPLVTPAMADGSDDASDWVLAINRENASLYLFDGSSLTDVSDRLRGVQYADIENRRSVQDDVFFHAAERGRVGGHRGPAIFHALGTGGDAEREKTDDAFYLEVARSLATALPPQTRHLTIVGDPRTAGRFREVLHPDGLDTTLIEASGEGQSPEAITEAMNSRVQASVEIPGETERDLATLATAAKNGRVGTLYVSTRHSMLESSTSADSEHLGIRQSGDIDRDAAPINELLNQATAQGAKIVWVSDSADTGTAGVVGTMRWETTNAA